MSSSPASPRRTEGIDVARAVASLLMIQGHAFDGWVTPASKQTLAYEFTRLLGTLPLPAFLVLAGVSVAWRVDTAARAGESAVRIRARVVRRGLGVVAWGYVVNVLFALMDGWNGPETFLRADVLHCIGLSIALVGGLGITGEGAGQSPSPRRLRAAALAIGLGAALACPWLSRLGGAISTPWSAFLGLWIDVPPVTRMPVVPLVAWFGVGVGAAQWMLAARREAGSESARGAPRRTLLTLAAMGLGLAGVGHVGTELVVAADPTAFSRRHPVVWLNLVDLAGRGLLVLALGAWFTDALSGRVRRAFVLLGRGSLWAYVFHLPFCYGLLGRPLAGALTMAEATVAMVGLGALSWAAVAVRDWGRRHLRQRFPRQVAASLVLLVPVVSGAVGCGADSSESALIDGPTEVELGIGETTFASVRDGEDVELGEGAQGGYHFWVAIRAQGLLKRDARIDTVAQPVETGRPRQFTRRQTDLAPIAPDPANRGGEDDAVQIYGIVGLMAVLSSPECFVDREVRLEVTVTDSDGTAATDERVVVARHPNSFPVCTLE